MAEKVLTGSGMVLDTDYKYLRWVGKTKGGKPCKIELLNAICLSNPGWNFGDKDDSLVEAEFTGCYEDEKLEKGDRTEPWNLIIDNTIVAGTAEVVLGVGKFYIGTSASDAKCVGLTRGGGSFVVERNYRIIAADDDPGPVKGRVQLEESVPKLKFTALQWLTKVETIFPGIKTGTAAAAAAQVKQ